jgi:hypothetical protein
MSLTKKMPKNRTSANNSHGAVDAEAADADARLELVDAAAAAAAAADARLELLDAAAAAADARLELVDAAAAADARLELVDAAAAAVADRLPLAAQPILTAAAPKEARIRSADELPPRLVLRRRLHSIATDRRVHHAVFNRPGDRRGTLFVRL